MDEIYIVFEGDIAGSWPVAVASSLEDAERLAAEYAEQENARNGRAQWELDQGEWKKRYAGRRGRPSRILSDYLTIQIYPIGKLIRQ